MTPWANENIGCHVISGVASFFQKSKIVKKLVPKKRLKNEVEKAAFMNVDELTRNVNCHQKSQLIKIMNSLWNLRLFVRCDSFGYTILDFEYNLYQEPFYILHFYF